MSTPALTRRQRQIVDFLERYNGEHGMSPTLEEIAHEFGVNKVTIFGHVAELERKAEAAEFIRDHMTKPVVAYVAGLSAPKGRTMGHAGAIISAFGESASEKVEILRDVGVAIAPNPSQIGSTMAEVIAKAA